MISLEEYKKALGFDAEGLSEEEILEARKIQDDLAEIFFVVWQERPAVVSPIIPEVYESK